MKTTNYVNVFQGNSIVSPKILSGVAKTWNPIKGLSGNTHPGAQLPFGKISVSAYSGGYPTGYGNNRLNCGEPVEKLYDCKKIIGVSHLHHSGTGAVGHYYNYALTIPFVDKFSVPELNNLVDEKASPGYYSARFKEKDVSFELTTDDKSAFHHYIFPKGNGNITIDFSNDGLYNDIRLRGIPTEAFVEIIDKNTVFAAVELQGVKLFFTAYSSSGTPSLFKSYCLIKEKSYTLCEDKNESFGVVFENTEKSTDIVLTISLKSKEKSLADNLVSRKKKIADVASRADGEWNEFLSKIEIEADDEKKQIFYSNLYHTLVKPSDWSGESIYYDDEDFLVNFTTLWDIYKTQLPLLFSIFTDVSKKIINTYLNLGRSIGLMPNLFDISSKMNGEAQQARFLESYMFCDAYYRGVEGIDWEESLDSLVNVLLNTDKDFFENGECSRATHTLDMAEACINLSKIAKEMGRHDIVDMLLPHTHKWENAFDKKTGLLREKSEYYEGNHWNYSFRPMNQMEKRIEMSGGDREFINLLDRFFGFIHQDDIDARFEGFNNETDMETPYAYNYVNRPDRLAEIIGNANKYIFVGGEGGAPGNVDSGGLSACYIWNTLGIFPVSGQDLIFIGMPYFDKATISLSNNKSFAIIKLGNGDFVKKAFLNGREITGFRFSVREMMLGGELKIYTE